MLVMAEEFRRIARIGHITPFTFFEISCDSFKKYKILIKKLNKLKEKGSFKHDNMIIFNEHQEISRIESIIHKEAIKAIDDYRDKVQNHPGELSLF